MYNKCCIENCGTKRKDVKMHPFPASEIRLKKWLLTINSDYLRSLSVQELQKLCVCQKHFEKRFFSEKYRLKVGSYPSLFSADEIASGMPTKVKEDVYENHDHNYSRKRKHDDHTYARPPDTTLAEKLPINVVVSSISDTENKGNVTDHSLTMPSTSKLSKYDDVLSQPAVPTATEDNELGIIGSTPIAEPKLTTPKKLRKGRLLTTTRTLTPKCRKLYKEYLRSKRQLLFSRRAKRALKFSKEGSFEKLTENMNPLAKQIMWMQLKQCTKGSNGRRFTDEEKLIGLSILKQSPKCYKFLQKIFILPSKTTLNKMISGLKIGTGINPQIFEAIKQEVSTWCENKKYCSILFDEMALEPGLTYEKHGDIIHGFVDLNEKIDEFADHALAFMLRGAIYKWQQPIVFYFCKGTTSSLQLKSILKTVITACINSGLLPLALVSDQGTSFQSAIKSLLEDTRRDQILADENTDGVIEIDGNKISVIFDPPHLLKGLRNNFLTKNIKLNGKISKWSDIVEVYETDCSHAQMRLMPKLNDELVIPDKIKKMKVKNCARVFSKTVAATLTYTSQFSQYADGRRVSSTLENTAETITFFDDLFDSVNGASLNSKSARGKPLRAACTSRLPHQRFWQESIQKLKEIRYVDVKGREKTVPSLKNWIVTLQSYLRLWQFFQKKNLKIMRPRYFTSDPMENFFGQVRAYNYRNNNPNCHTFVNTFRSLLITRFIKFHSGTFNCEDDPANQLIKLKQLFVPSEKADVQCLSEINLEPHTSRTMPRSVAQERLNVHARAYTAGWVTRKIFTKIKCGDCVADLTTREVSAVHNWMQKKEYRTIKKMKLTYPSENAVRAFGVVTEEANAYLEHSPAKNNISEMIKRNIMSKYSFDFLSCETHKKEIEKAFLEHGVNLVIHNWCCTINKIMKGTDVSRLIGKSLPRMQSKALVKFQTKLKNKNLNKYLLCFIYIFLSSSL